MKKKLLLVDGHSILNRAFYGLPDLTNSEGLHTNGVLGFLNILFRFLEEEKASQMPSPSDGYEFEKAVCYVEGEETDNGLDGVAGSLDGGHHLLAVHLVLGAAQGDKGNVVWHD